jgi:hypothetical protein
MGFTEAPGRRGDVDLDRHNGVLSGDDAPVTRGGRDEVLGHRVNDRGEGRSPIEERLSVGGAHHEGGDDGGVGFRLDKEWTKNS